VVRAQKTGKPRVGEGKAAKGRKSGARAVRSGELAPAGAPEHELAAAEVAENAAAPPAPAAPPAASVEAAVEHTVVTASNQPNLKVLFVVVSLGRATMSQLARAVGMTLSTATGVADRLVAHGLVRRVNDDADRRLVWLQPTDASADLVARFAQIGRRQLSLVARHLSAEELASVARAQDLVYRAMLEITSEELFADDGEVVDAAAQQGQTHAAGGPSGRQP
jgi:DNA-binding MarR family transcriptional regulator